MLGGGRVGWVWLVQVSSRAGVWALVPRVGSGWLVGRPGGPLVGGGWAFLVYVRAFSDLFTFDLGSNSLRCCDTGIDRHPHVVGWSGISADDAFPRQGAGHHSVRAPLRIH